MAAKLIRNRGLRDWRVRLSARKARFRRGLRWRRHGLEQLEDRTLLSASLPGQSGSDDCLPDPAAAPLGSSFEQSSPGGSLADDSLAAASLGEADVAAVARSINAFAWDLYRELQAQNDENLFLSPMSISTALAMLYAGARGETAAQMADVLHYTLDQDALHPAFGAFVDDLNAAGEAGDFELSVANALWGQQGFPFLEPFLNLLESCYGAGLQEVDFIADPEAARQTINQWVEQQTQEKIKDLLPEGLLNELTRLVLTNAIYFKGQWTYEFDPLKTRTEPFTLVSGEQVDVRMMHGSGEYAYMERDGFQVLELPYDGDRLSMVVLLPATAVPCGPDAGVMPADLKDWLAGLRHREVVVSLPKFEMTTEFRLKDVLMSMGMTDAFLPDLADLSGIADLSDAGGRLFVKEGFHKAFVKVNEQGTEAAAATGLVITLEAMPPPPAYFTADHPFHFLIRDRETGAILFMGRVMEPVWEGDDEPVPGEIHGSKWNDLNANGTWDEGEPPLEGWKIYLDLNGNGKWDPPRPDIVHEIDPWGPPAAITDPAGSVTLRERLTDTPILAVSAAGDGVSISERVFGRETGSGRSQTVWSEFSSVLETRFDEPMGEVSLDFLATSAIRGHQGVLRAFNASGELLEEQFTEVLWTDQTETLTISRPDNDIAYVEATGAARWGPVMLDRLRYVRRAFPGEPWTLTDAEGQYEFTDLRPSRYRVAEVSQPGWVQTFPELLALNSWSDLTFRGAHFVRVDPGEVVEDINFGNVKGGEIHGSKWNDLDGDGTWDDDEPPLGGWTIYLDTNQNGQLDRCEPRTVTDDEGQYSFTGLRPGDYIVAEVLQDGWEQTFPEPAPRLVDTSSWRVPCGPGAASDFGFHNVAARPVSWNGRHEVDVTFRVAWPDMSWRVESTWYSLVGNEIYLTARQGEVGAQVVWDQYVTVTVPALDSGISATLAEYEYNTCYLVPPISWKAAATIVLEGGGHPVSLHPGQVVEDVDFGNQVVSHVQIVGNHPDANPPGWTWRDVDGDIVMPVYRGREGYAELHFDEHHRLEHVAFHDTNRYSSLCLVVRQSDAGGDQPLRPVAIDPLHPCLVVRQSDAGGDGEVDIGMITADAPLGMLGLRDANLVGAGIEVEGPVRTVVLNDVADGAALRFGCRPEDRLTLIAGRIGEGVDLVFGGTLAYAMAKGWAGGTIQVADARWILIRDGDLGADLVVPPAAADTASTNAPGGFGRIMVVGGDLTGSIDVPGQGGAVMVRRDREGNGGSIASPSSFHIGGDVGGIFTFGGDIELALQVGGRVGVIAAHGGLRGQGGNIAGVFDLAGGAAQIAAWGGNIQLQQLTVGSGGVNLQATELPLLGGGFQGGGISLLHDSTIYGATTIAAYGGNIGLGGTLTVHGSVPSLYAGKGLDEDGGTLQRLPAAAEAVRLAVDGVLGSLTVDRLLLDVDVESLAWAILNEDYASHTPGPDDHGSIHVRDGSGRVTAANGTFWFRDDDDGVIHMFPG